MIMREVVGGYPTALSVAGVTASGALPGAAGAEGLAGANQSPYRESWHGVIQAL